MSKYSPLARILEQTGKDYIPKTFAEIEEILDFKLPPTARKKSAWWSNNTKGHTQAHAWVSVGYKTEKVKIEDEKLIFRRDETIPAKEIEMSNGNHPLFGKLKGQITIAVDFDITEPTGVEWEAAKE